MHGVCVYINIHISIPAYTAQAYADKDEMASFYRGIDLPLALASWVQISTSCSEPRPPAPALLAGRQDAAGAGGLGSMQEAEICT